MYQRLYVETQSQIEELLPACKPPPVPLLLFVLISSSGEVLPTLVGHPATEAIETSITLI